MSALRVAAAHERALIRRLKTRIALGNGRARARLRLLPRVLPASRLKLTGLLSGLKLSRLAGELAGYLTGYLAGYLAGHTNTGLELAGHTDTWLLPRELPWDLPRLRQAGLGNKSLTRGSRRLRWEPRYRRRTLRPGRTSGRPRRFRWLGRPGRPRRAPVRERPGLLPRARLKLLVEKRKVAFVAQVRSLRQTPISEDVAVPAGVVSAAVAPGAVALTSRGRAVVPRLGDVQAERVRSRGARPLFGYCWL